MRTALCLAIAVAFLTTTAGLAAAADPKKEAPAAKPAAGGKADPNGTWTWTMNRPDGQSMERKVTLKLDGGKLTGTSSGRGGDSPIEEGSFKNGEVAFKLVREREGQKFVQTFKGKVEGDVIKGTMTFNRGEGEQSRPWEAKRAK